MEAEIRDQVNKTSKNPEETKVAVAKGSSGEPVCGENGDSRAKTSDGERAAAEGKKASNCEVVIDIKSGVVGESSKAEKICRICHFGSELSSGGSELIPLGCDCRGELGVSHQHCAQVWFSQKRNRLCEICGKTAKNINSNNAEDTAIFMMEWNEMRLVAATLDSSRESSRRCKQSFCNFLLGCLVLAFVLPWFLRGMDIL
ncbi:hypothetical protein Pfo_022514 [Paulownia fortunei]|nr:hypothetical protein Pfo_022514 [Paulownia fortunei]